MTEDTADARFSPDAEAAIDAVLADIMAGDDDEPEEAVEDDEQPEPGSRAEADEEDEDAEEASSEPAAQEPDAEWKSAREKLQLAGFSKAYLDTLDREQTITEWSQRSPREAEIQRAFRERAELQKRLEELQATEQAEQGVPTAALDLSDLEERAVEELGDLGKDLVAALRGAQAKSAPTALEEQLATSTAMLQDLLRDRAQAELGKRFPPLRKDPQVYEKVEQLAGQLGDTDLHRDVQGIARYTSLMESAASLLGLSAAADPDAERETREKRSRQRSQGTPTRGGKPAVQKPRSDGEVLDAKIRFIQSNPSATAEEVRKAFGG